LNSLIFATNLALHQETALQAALPQAEKHNCHRLPSSSPTAQPKLPQTQHQEVLQLLGLDQTRLATSSALLSLRR
jgi:hypothetical protein